MTTTNADLDAAIQSVSTLSTSMFQTLSERRDAVSGATSGALLTLWSQLETLALDWLERIPAGTTLPDALILSGSERIVSAMPDRIEATSCPQDTKIFCLIRETSADFLNLAVRKGLDGGHLILPLADGLSGRPECAPRARPLEPYRALLDQLAGSHVARDGFKSSAWETVKSYERAPALKLALLRRQIEAFSDELTATATRLSRQGRKCGPLLILALAGARIGELQPPKGSDLSDRRMQILCQRLSSAHGLIALHDHFGPLEELLPNLQSRLDAYLHAEGAPSS